MSTKGKLAILIAVFLVLAGVFSVSAVSSAAAQKVAVCHITGSKTNEVVVIDTSVESVDSHLAHGDFLPTPEHGCDGNGGPLPE